MLSSSVLLGGGGHIKPKMRLIRRENAVYDSVYQLCTEACRMDRCTVCRENYKREMVEGRKRLGEAPFGYKEIQYFNDLISKQTFTRPP